MKRISMEGFEVGAARAFVLIAGPCVIEDENKTRDIAAFLKELTGRLNIPFL
jgi:2-dehydro-3-deoxyphosphooctonate aldolase (KDO 8-P synthase)